VEAFGATGNVVAKNFCEANEGHGIALATVQEGVVTGNTVVGSGMNGIFLGFASVGNAVTKNAAHGERPRRRLGQRFSGRLHGRGLRRGRDTAAGRNRTVACQSISAVREAGDVAGCRASFAHRVATMPSTESVPSMPDQRALRRRS
jgi:hypothetical protein